MTLITPTPRRMIRANFTFDYLVKRKNCKTNQTFTSTNIMDYSSKLLRPVLPTTNVPVSVTS